MLSRKQASIFWIILVLQCLLLLIFVFFRLIDYDEGSYLSAARLVSQGNLPYQDFFYPQMPYLPYAYSLISQYGFCSLYYGRLISVFAGLFLSILIFWFAYRFSGDATLSLLLFFLYSFNGLTINWHSVVKTLVFSDLFGFLSFLCFAFYLLFNDNKRRLMIFLAGLFIGVSFNFRLILLPMLLIEGFLILLFSVEKNTKRKIFDLILLFCGAIVSSLPAIYLFFKGPSQFVFGNLGYHLMWGGKVIKMTFTRKAFTLSKFVFYPQNLLILLLTGLGVVTFVRKIKRGNWIDPRDKVIATAIICSVVLITICFVMSPTQFQYYEQALPYILISFIPAWHKLRDGFRRRRPQASAVLVVYFVLILPFAAIFLFGARQKDRSFEINTVEKVVQAIEENSQAGDVILCGWPAYAVLSGRETVPGLETWGWEVASYLSEQQVARLKLIDSLGVERLIREREVGLIVWADWFPPPYGNLIERNYDLVESTPFADVYVVKIR